MAYCTNCSAELRESAVFCPKCGARNANASGNPSGIPTPIPQYYQMTPQEMRKANVQEAEKVYSYFMAKKSLYDELSHKQNMLSLLDKQPKKWYWMPFALLELVVYAAASSVALGLLVLAAIIAAFILWKKAYNKKDCERVDRKVETQVRIEMICDELAAYYDAYGDCPIGPEYTTPAALNALLECIRSGRANSFQEAINLLVNDKHMNAIRASASQAAQSANTAAAFSALNFFFNS